MGAQVDLPKKEEDVECMEQDEMHTYVGSKKTIVGDVSDKNGYNP
jgi:hypothetical protein